MANGKDFGASLAAECWKNADDLWGDFKHTDFGKIILPFTLLRRLECVLEPTREQVREQYATHKDSGIDIGLILRQTSQYPFYNTSSYSLATLGSTKTRQNLQDYVARFSENARVIFEQFDFSNTLVRLDKANLLYRITQNFANIDLHPNAVPDRVMSTLYEHLIRRFGAEVNEGAEDFMTPRDVVHLATTLVLDPDAELFEATPGLIRTLYDPTCGTGGFLSDAMAYVADYGNAEKIAPVLIPHGQELEPETHAVALTNMLLRQHPSDPSRDLSQNIAGPSSTLSRDAYAGQRFHYGLANPPFGKKWDKDKEAVVNEYNEKGYGGRFGPGLPSIGDGSMLFLLHLADKMETPDNGGGRAAIVLSGSPLFNGNANSGESEIRRYLLENDLVEAIVALPTQLFFRTGIGTYLWILTTKKDAHRQGKVQLIDATDQWTSMKNEGNKRRRISSDQMRAIADIHVAFEDGEHSRIYDYHYFGYRRIKLLRPLRMHLEITEAGLDALTQDKQWQKLTEAQQQAWHDALSEHLGQTYRYGWVDDFAAATVEAGNGRLKATKSFINTLRKAFGVRDPDGDPVTDNKGNTLSDSSLTDYENVPLSEGIEDYFVREVLPHVPDAWIDESYTDKRDERVGRVGYEINFNRYFYRYIPPRPLEDIDADLDKVEAEIADLLAEVTE